MVPLGVHLSVQLRMHLMVDLKVHRRVLLRDLYKDVPERSFEVELKRVL